MKNSIMAVSAIALVAMNVAATPAMAETLPTTTTQTAMQAACDAAKPADIINSQNPVSYSAVPAIKNQVSTTKVTNVEIVEQRDGGVYVGETGWIYTSGSEHRNGLSTNIHGRFKNVVEYTGAVLVQDVTTQEETVFTFNCDVTRTTRGGTQAVPNPRIDDMTATQLGAPTTTRYEERQPNTFVTLNDQRVICISPGTKKGVWTNQNGYTGTCSSALYLAVAQGGPIPSNSVPGVTRLLPNAVDTVTPENLYSPQMPNLPEDFLEE